MTYIWTQEKEILMICTGQPLSTILDFDCLFHSRFEVICFSVRLKALAALAVVLSATLLPGTTLSCVAASEQNSDRLPEQTLWQVAAATPATEQSPSTGSGAETAGSGKTKYYSLNNEENHE